MWVTVRGLLVILVLFTAFVTFASEQTKVNLKGTNEVRTRTFFHVNQERVVVLEDEVRGWSMAAVRSAIREFAKEPLQKAFLVLDSPGGSVVAGQDLIKEIIATREGTGLRLICIIQNEAYSMAAIIQSFCYESYIIPSGLLMYHEASYGVRGSQSDIDKDVKLIEKMLAHFTKQLARQNGLTLEEWLEFRGEERWFTSEEAVQYGLVDGLVTSFYHENDSIEPEVNIFSLFFQTLPAKVEQLFNWR
jgi:ATP-dependent Clp protease protease subunit